MLDLNRPEFRLPKLIITFQLIFHLFLVPAEILNLMIQICHMNLIVFHLTSLLRTPIPLSSFIHPIIGSVLTGLTSLPTRFERTSLVLIRVLLRIGILTLANIIWRLSSFWLPIFEP